MSASEIAPGVHLVRQRRTNVYLIDEGDGVTAIDAGLAGSGPGIIRALAELGRKPEDLVRAVVTHGHPDHAGGAPELAALGAEVLIHEADAAAIRVDLRDAFRNPSRGAILQAMSPVPHALGHIADGDILPVLGELHVIHTPGHTAGSVCLWAPRDRMLFVGDALQFRFGRLSHASLVFSADHAQARRSVERLQGLDIGVIVFGHYPPMRVGARGALVALVAGSGNR
jgi:glyoxylase-like metal-dependent hydrolase (beta-lactamase superfamily II)